MAIYWEFCLHHLMEYKLLVVPLWMAALAPQLLQGISVLFILLAPSCPGILSALSTPSLFKVQFQCLGTELTPPSTGSLLWHMSQVLVNIRSGTRPFRTHRSLSTERTCLNFRQFPRCPHCAWVLREDGEDVSRSEIGPKIVETLPKEMETGIQATVSPWSKRGRSACVHQERPVCWRCSCSLPTTASLLYQPVKEAERGRRFQPRPHLCMHNALMVSCMSQAQGIEHRCFQVQTIH